MSAPVPAFSWDNPYPPRFECPRLFAACSRFSDTSEFAPGLTVAELPFHSLTQGSGRVIRP
jgi:hypothetical protein